MMFDLAVLLAGVVLTWLGLAGGVAIAALCGVILACTGVVWIVESIFRKLQHRARLRRIARRNRIDWGVTERDE
jgi:membrane protein implicated in regulation of membrane protease activity